MLVTERRPTEQAHLVFGVRALARDDPDQDVRFEAEKSIFERSQAPAPKRSN